MQLEFSVVVLVQSPLSLSTKKTSSAKILACIMKELNWAGKNSAKEVNYLHSTSRMAGKARPTIAVTSVRSSRTSPLSGNIKLGQNSNSLFLRII